jgi:hypothetical protein
MVETKRWWNRVCPDVVRAALATAGMGSNPQHPVM